MRFKQRHAQIHTDREIEREFVAPLTVRAAAASPSEQAGDTVSMRGLSHPSSLAASLVFKTSVCVDMLRLFV